MSTRSAPFTPEEHGEWFDRAVSDPELLFLVAFRRSAFVGYVRYRRCDADGAEIAIAVRPEHAGHGYAREMLMASETLARDYLGVTKLIALILYGNVASIRTFESCSYRYVSDEERLDKRHLRFEKVIASTR